MSSVKTRFRYRLGRTRDTLSLLPGTCPSTSEWDSSQTIYGLTVDVENQCAHYTMSDVPIRASYEDGRGGRDDRHVAV